MTTPKPNMPMSPYLHDALQFIDSRQQPETDIEGLDVEQAVCERTHGYFIDRMTLTALLRICHELPDAESTSALLDKNALTIVETGETQLVSPCELALRSGLLRAVNTRNKTQQRYGMLSLTQPRPSSRFSDDLWQAIAQPEPLIVIVPCLSVLPRRVRAAMTKHVKLPLLSKALMLEHLRIVYPQSQSKDADLHDAMPDDDEIALVSTLQMLLALRSSTRTAAVDALQRLVKPQGAELQFPRLKRIRGLKETRTFLEQTARDLHDYHNGALKWDDVPRGLLFRGPPGTGKTAAVRALAADADLHLQACSVAKWQSSGHLGDMLKAMRADFAAAKENAPAILFIDEIDSITNRSRTAGHNASYDVTVTNAVIELLDGIETMAGVIVIGACNAPERLDPALIRPGRFDRHLRFSLPDRRAIRDMLEDAFSNAFDETLLDWASKRLIGLSGADVAAISREAYTKARQRGDGSKLRADDLRAAIASRVPDRCAQKETLWRFAVHEASHVVALYETGRGLPDRVEIGPVGGRVTGALPPADETLAAFEDELVVLLAGRAAEIVLLGFASAGSGGSAVSDLARATQIATAIESAYGLGQRGLLWTAPEQVSLAHDRPLRLAVQKRLAQADAAAMNLVRKHAVQLERVAKALLADSSIDREKLTKLFEVDATSATETALADQSSTPLTNTGSLV